MTFQLAFKKLILVTLATLAFANFSWAAKARTLGTSCQQIISNNDRAYLELAYKNYLRQQKAEIAPYLPSTVKFNNQTYRVLDFLGSGAEGLSVRVVNERGENSIIKMYMAFVRGRIFPEWDLFNFIKVRRAFKIMNETADHPYNILATDYQAHMIQFHDIRALPLIQYRTLLQAVGAPETLMSLAYDKTATTATGWVSDHNVVFDIDNLVLVPIDPK